MPRTKTMISAAVIESDEFVDMSPSAQSLYMHLMFGADGLGCIEGVRRVIRSCGARDGDYAELLDNGFVITAESPSDNADVIAHWFVHNNLNDRDMSVGKHAALVDAVLVFCNRNDRRYVPVSEAMPKGYARVHDVIDAVKRALFGGGEPNVHPTGTQRKRDATPNAQVAQSSYPMGTQREPNGNTTLKETDSDSDIEIDPDIERGETRAPAREATRTERCPDCGAPCLVSDTPVGIHGYCNQCGDFFIDVGGEL